MKRKDYSAASALESRPCQMLKAFHVLTNPAATVFMINESRGVW
jgi:hypothetical protein